MKSPSLRVRNVFLGACCARVCLLLRGFPIVAVWLYEEGRYEALVPFMSIECWCIVWRFLWIYALSFRIANMRLWES
ncbi:hypothetical protein F5146DRAFT_320445 [Armillaria mellea]|nr:hypothetical protein F5146DRAFT_320445 [Armillaria mellea]